MPTYCGSPPQMITVIQILVKVRMRFSFDPPHNLMIQQPNHSGLNVYFNTLRLYTAGIIAF